MRRVSAKLVPSPPVGQMGTDGQLSKDDMRSLLLQRDAGKEGGARKGKGDRGRRPS